MKKIITCLSVVALFVVLFLNGSIMMSDSTNNVGFNDLFKIEVASAKTVITVDCTDNPSGEGSTIYRRCEAGCPKVEALFGPKNGTCTYEPE